MTRRGEGSELRRRETTTLEVFLISKVQNQIPALGGNHENNLFPAVTIGDELVSLCQSSENMEMGHYATK